MALTSPILHLKLDETSGNAIDSSGNGHTFINTNVTYGPGKIGNGAIFSGVSDGRLQTTLHLPVSFSLSFYVKPSRTGQTEMLFSHGKGSYSAGEGSFFEIKRKSSGTISVDTGETGGNSHTMEGVNNIIPENKTTHIMVSCNSSNLYKLYINGSFICSGTLYRYGITAPFSIGNRSYQDAFVFSGMIDEVTLFAGEISMDENSQIFNSGRGNAYPFTPTPSLYGCVTAWNMEETSGSMLDSIGTNHLLNTNVSSVTGKVGNGAGFNGSTSKLIATSFPVIGNPVTGTFAIAYKTTSSARQQIATFGCQDVNDGLQFYIYNDNKFHCDFSAKGGPSSTNTVNDGVWHSAIITLNAGTATLYHDGANIGSFGAGALKITSIGTGPQKSLGIYETTYHPFNGSMDMAYWWTRVLSPAEIVEVSSATKQYPWVDSVQSGFYPLIHLLGQGQIW